MKKSIIYSQNSNLISINKLDFEDKGDSVNLVNSSDSNSSESEKTFSFTKNIFLPSTSQRDTNNIDKNLNDTYTHTIVDNVLSKDEKIQALSELVLTYRKYFLKAQSRVDRKNNTIDELTEYVDYYKDKYKKYKDKYKTSKKKAINK